MKFVVNARSIPKSEELIETKHDSFVSHCDQLRAPWTTRRGGKVPKMGGGLSVGVAAKEFLGPGLSGGAWYHHRGDLQDEASSDDFLNLSFNPKKIDYEYVAENVVAAYAMAFDAYFCEVIDDEFTFVDYDERKRLGVDRRHQVYRVPAVFFWREDYCLKAFGLSAGEINARLANHVAAAKLVGGGVYGVLTYNVLPHGEIEPLSNRVKQLLVS